MTNAVQMSSAAQDEVAVPTPDEAVTVAAPEAAADETATVTFAEIGLPAAVVTALAKNGITVPSPIQAMAVPDAIAGRNVLGRAQTGSGKTLAFGLPMLARLSQHEDRPAAKRPRALVLVPTRELAIQVVDSLYPYASAVGVNVRAAVGGMPFTKQVEQLRRGVDILVATPGRLGDHLRQGTCILDEVEITALDEADQMADMGFLPEVRSILDATRADGQRLLFSATLDREVQSLVRQFLADHVTHSTEDGKASVDTMEHYVLLVERGQKDVVLAEIGAREGRTIMFARTKLGCEGITDRLRAVGIPAESLHGGKAQNQRTRVLDRFKTGRTPVLVATDVAARGIHVDGIDLVVHVDPPADHKDYLHRAGRTARAGEKGTVVAIVLPNQRRLVRKLTGMAGVDATAVNVAPGSEELANITGAKAPSGEPVREPAFKNDRRERSFGDRPRRDGGGYRGNNDSGGYRGDRPQRSFGDRPQRSEGGYRGNSENRSYGDRPQRTEGGYRGNSENRSYGDRPQRTEGGYRGNSENRSYGDRPQRTEGGYRGNNDRPQRSEGGYRGNSSYGDRPQRTEGGYRGNNDRPQRSEGGYRGNSENRSYGDRPQRTEGGYRGNNDRPQRSEGGYRGNNDRSGAGAGAGQSGGFRSRTERRSYDGFDGPQRDR
ncbi:DEAD/DEAH box helicase [Rhodococcus tukisamuensis]|uniref:Superfamily II DNA and RNA helicase n=1 Tax=Rhodococcus tukisamuensis TaxID=168276 RepID=A0A1G6UVA9_9NOCA|nr:DEAD/DEAH box helicase [Rhodococcus tukisamuensis]SDD45320.1 Superfamily II DNA and RNA helicase [Rhodococcus tukisamuensis]